MTSTLDLHIRRCAPSLIAAMAAALILATPLQAGQPPAPPAAPASSDANADTERQLETARQRLDAAAREVAELSARLGGNVEMRVLRLAGPPPRAMLGVQIDTKPGAGGAHVLEVSPGGAAAEAGIEAGDVISAIDGQDLSKADDPGRVLVERMRSLKPDSKVKLRVVHVGKARDVEVTPRPLPRDMAWGGPMPSPPMQSFGGRERMPMQGFGFRSGEGPPGPGPHPGPGRENREGPMWGDRGGFDDLELATLSPRLGSYFGAKSGVLVVRAGGAALKLEDGDVITAIDGREPTSAAHATRILRSYQRGEKILIKVIRDHKPQQLEVTTDRR
jgi:S1-C subfamily serine protease